MRYLIAAVLLLLFIPTANAQCEGYIRFMIEPTFAAPSSHVLPSISELENCDGEIVEFRMESCSGTIVSSCTIAGGSCTGNSFAVPDSADAYTYYACVGGKEASLIYMVGYSSLPEFHWIGIVQIMILASVVLILFKKSDINL